MAIQECCYFNGDGIHWGSVHFFQTIFSLSHIDFEEGPRVPFLNFRGVMVPRFSTQVPPLDFEVGHGSRGPGPTFTPYPLFHVQVAEFQPPNTVRNYFTSAFQTFYTRTTSSHSKMLEL